MDEVMRELSAGRLTALTMILWTLLALLLSIMGGAVAGILMGRRHLGSGLAAAMGAMYGPSAAVPGILAGLIVLAFM